MSAVPQGAFAARKIREMKIRQLLMINMTENEERNNDSRRDGGGGGGTGGSTYNKNLTEGM